jgi:small conductance mechanosensitive channel
LALEKVAVPLCRWSKLPVFVFLWLVAAAPLPAPAEASAQPAGTETGGIPVEQLRKLRTTLADDAARAALIADLDALIAVAERRAEAEEPTSGRLGRELVAAIHAAQQGLATVPPFLETTRTDLRQLAGWAGETWRSREQRSQAARQIAMFVGILLVGWTGEWGLARLLSPLRLRLMGRMPPTFARRCLHGLERLAIELLPIVGFFAAAGAFGVIGGPASRLTAAGFSLALMYGGARAVLAAGRLLLAPKAPDLRLLSLSTPTAEDLFRWLRRIVLVVATAAFLVIGSKIAGVPPAMERLISGLAALSVAALLIGFLLSQRQRWRGWLLARANEAEDLREIRPVLLVLAETGHLAAVAVVAGLAIIAILGLDGGTAFWGGGFAGTALTLGFASLILYGLGRLFRWARTLAAAATTATSPWRLLEPHLSAVRWIATALLLVAVVIALLQSWGVGALDWLSSPTGGRLAGSAASIFLVVAIAAVVWQLLSTAIARQIEGGSGSIRASPRARTLLPLLRKVLFISLALIIGMVVLTELGVAITPLLAGAGIVGLAVGFGAQKLVQDVITGIFILIEDAVAIGDVVTVAGIGGSVEDLSIRSIRLRDVSGNVHTIPFSSVGTVTNMTKGFSYFVLDIGVAYREDTDEVAEVCRQIVEELRADPAFGPHIVEPLEVLGVDRFADSAVIIKARIKTLPSKQWRVGREFNRRMKKRFDQLGIEFPSSRRTPAADVDEAGKVAPASARVDPGAPAKRG